MNSRAILYQLCGGGAKRFYGWIGLGTLISCFLATINHYINKDHLSPLVISDVVGIYPEYTANNCELSVSFFSFLNQCKVAVACVDATFAEAVMNQAKKLCDNVLIHADNDYFYFKQLPFNAVLTIIVIAGSMMVFGNKQAVARRSPVREEPEIEFAVARNRDDVLQRQIALQVLEYKERKLNRAYDVGIEQLAEAEPVRGEPVRGEPVRGEPVRGEPVRGEPVRGEPVRGEPVRGESVFLAGGYRNYSLAHGPVRIFPEEDIQQVEGERWQVEEQGYGHNRIYRG
jgi:hypothetical protein